MSKARAGKSPKRRSGRNLKEQLNYYLMCAPGMIWLFLFSIVPMSGILMAFQNYKPKKGIFGSQFIGMENFEYLFSMKDAQNVIINTLIIGSDVWKEFGYNAVIYLAALTSINPTLYEAASIDGATRWEQTRYITLPSLTNTIVLLTVLALSNVLNAGFDQVFNMYNPLVYSTSDIIDTWVYRIGLTKMQFSLATAAGLFKSVVSFVLITVSYLLAYKFADYTIF